MTIILTQSTTRGQEEVVRLLVGVEGVDLDTRAMGIQMGTPWTPDVVERSLEDQATPGPCPPGPPGQRAGVTGQVSPAIRQLLIKARQKRWERRTVEEERRDEEYKERERVREEELVELRRRQKELLDKVMDKLKEDNKKEEEDMVEEQEREEREAPSCPVSTSCSVLSLHPKTCTP